MNKICNSQLCAYVIALWLCKVHFEMSIPGKNILKIQRAIFNRTSKVYINIFISKTSQTTQTISVCKQVT